MTRVRWADIIKSHVYSLVNLTENWCTSSDFDISLSKHNMTMTSFAVTLYGQYCRQATTCCGATSRKRRWRCSYSYFEVFVACFLNLTIITCCYQGPIYRGLGVQPFQYFLTPSPPSIWAPGADSNPPFQGFYDHGCKMFKSIFHRTWTARTLVSWFSGKSLKVLTSDTIF